MADKVHDSLLDALRTGLADAPGESRLFRRGRLPGVFPGERTPHTDAAELALSDGLLEKVRAEVKGKVVTEWVRLTAKGVEYLHAHESPRAVLAELKTELSAARTGVPLWLERLRGDLADFLGHAENELRRVTARLEALERRVDVALRRFEAAGPAVPAGVESAVPWGDRALAFLDRRKSAGAGGPCPLPDLFAAVRAAEPDLSLADFQDGLRRLSDARALELLPFAEPLERLPDPEYALPDGGHVLYFADR